MNIQKIIIILLPAFIGWALCAATMGISNLLRNILELGFGLLYLIGAIFDFLLRYH